MSRIVYITRKEHFNAAHKLFKPEWSNQQNEEVFGKCANPNWHGHNFELFVTVKGIPNIETGFLVNLKDLKRIINETVIDKVDHKNLNLDVDFMKDVMPSIENFAIKIWEQIQTQLEGCELHCIKLYETNNNYIEYYG
jgi:6-pyruvoyltetrahydropterin/6-carboxytetrahydropterin synthase